jgi:hypothetical protein
MSGSHKMNAQAVHAGERHTIQCGLEVALVATEVQEVQDLASGCTDLCGSKLVDPMVVQHRAVDVVSHHRLADAAGVASLDFMFMTKHARARFSTSIVKGWITIKSMREHRHQRCFAAIDASTHCTAWILKTKIHFAHSLMCPTFFGKNIL